MIIHSAEFIKSAVHYKDCPPAILPEYAFIGRSNVGKSSLINMLTGFGSLAKISSTPGKTQLINHFNINNSWYLADLPGFGYAKVSKKQREKWEDMIKKYLQNRENLVCCFLLIDCRHSPQKPDIKSMEWFAIKGIPFVLVFTKTDKLGKVSLSTKIEKYLSELAHTWEPLPPYFITSAETQHGREDILRFIHEHNLGFRNQQ